MDAVDGRGTPAHVVSGLLAQARIVDVVDPAAHGVEGVGIRNALGSGDLLDAGRVPADLAVFRLAGRRGRRKQDGNGTGGLGLCDHLELVGIELFIRRIRVLVPDVVDARADGDDVGIVRDDIGVEPSEHCGRLVTLHAHAVPGHIDAVRGEAPDDEIDVSVAIGHAVPGDRVTHEDERVAVLDNFLPAL